MIRRLLLAAAALSALLTSTGCGGGGARLSHQEYEREMQAIARDLNSQALGMERLVKAPSETAFTELLGELSELMSEARDRVGAINPPEEIDEPHDTLADGLDEVADILGEAADRAEDGDLFAAMGALEKAPDDLGDEVRDAIRDIRAAGYYIGDAEDWG